MSIQQISNNRDPNSPDNKQENKNTQNKPKAHVHPNKPRQKPAAAPTNPNEKNKANPKKHVNRVNPHHGANTSSEENKSIKKNVNQHTGQNTNQPVSQLRPNNNHKKALIPNTNKPKNNPNQQTNNSTQNIQNKKKQPNVVRKSPIKIIPLGGLNEIGKNMTCYEYENDMFIVDCGLAFPDADMLGVDIVIPDFSYIEKNKNKLRAVVLTHGHEDHIGGLAYFLKKFNVPVYGTKLTIGLVEGKLKEHGLLNRARLNVINKGGVIKFACFAVEFINVNHSIPDAVSLAITTPVGVILQTGDFKIDYSPIQGEIIDIARFSEIGKNGVICLLSDSTNAERPGATMSEKVVGSALETLFAKATDKRIIVATFASNIHRVQQIVDNAIKFQRKVAVSGRSMVNVVNKALEIGYLKIPEKILIDIDHIKNYNREKVVIITTGSQGEPMSALSRMASGDHKNVNVTNGDCIIISATPIPGNEKHVNRVVNELMKQGAEVMYKSIQNIHVSGHACQDELKMMLSLIKPKYFLPVHGEYKHLRAHADLALSMNVPESNIHIGSIGQVIEIDNVDMRMAGTVPAGRILVDGLGVGDVGAIVLRDRKHLSEDGLIVVVATIEGEFGTLVSGPDIVSRGFIYIRESEELIDQSKRIIKDVLDKCSEKNIKEWGAIKLNIKYSLSDYIYKKTKRSPMILPIIMEI